VDGRVLSWRVRDKYTCNEFCADGIEDCPPPERRASSNGARSARIGFA
jgi:hypothetical protein